MDNYVEQSHFSASSRSSVNNLKMFPAAGREAVLLSFDASEGLSTIWPPWHGLLSDVKYQSLSGTRTPRDFVEYPRSNNEMWARRAHGARALARHYQTASPCQAELLQKMIAAQELQPGLRLYGAAGRIGIDLALHK